MKTPAKNTGISSTPKKQKQKQETDHDSMTNDPTQPDTEISHKKTHRVGEPTKPDKTK